MKKKLIIGVIAGILLISLLPFPQKVNRTFYGVNTQNGEMVDITLEMKYLRFLFLKDKLYGTITVDTKTKLFSYGEHLYYTGRTSINQEKDLAYNFSGWYYNDTMYMREYENGVVAKATVGFEGLLVHMSSDFNKILIFHSAKDEIENQEDARYIGSVNQNQLEETQKYFSGYYD